MEVTVNNSPLRFLVASIGRPFASAARGQIFELWAHKHLSRGGTFKIKQLHDDSAGGESELTLPEMECLTFSGLDDLKEKHSQASTKPLYLEPTKVNFEAVDSISENKAFQMTVSHSHPVKMKGLKEIMDSTGTADNFKLYFVVPDDVYRQQDAFKKKQVYETTKGERALRVSSALNKVEQYVLCLPLNDVLPTV